jgi:hypothetical protein
MAFTITTTTKNTLLNNITTAIGSGANVVIYSGTAPTNADASLSGNTVLATLPCSSTFAPGAASGALTANAITQENASASGTASFYRILTSGSVVICQGAVGTTGTDMILNTTALVSGGPVDVTSYTISM